MASAAAYFQGGDFVELLSAQGKAPAAMWKLHGKVVKSFEKSIKGNAFQLDGSAETKMQLPKTATTHSLGLAQRFLIFQLTVPCARAVAIEVGFSDFQKIRRRFVFASAFRETATTSLHVQIPFDARVPRDQWLSLVFDLHALTETCFPGSMFRSIESISISGSCKLKRIFTTKDAPTCDSARLQPKQPLAVAGGKPTHPRVVLPASYAEMKDIPKQFVFSSGTGPIPTEYFVLSGNAHSREAVVATGSSSSSGAMSRTGLSSYAGGKSAPLPPPPPASGPTRQRTPAKATTSSSRPVRSAAARARPQRFDNATSPIPATSDVAAAETKAVISVVTTTTFSQQLHRQSIIAAIKEKLDVLSDDDEHEAERNATLFLQHASIRTPGDSGEEAGAEQSRASVRSSLISRSLGSRSIEVKYADELPKPLRGSMFSFAPTLEIDSDLHAAVDTTTATTPAASNPKKSLFDFDSLLAPTKTETVQSSARKSASTRVVEADGSRQGDDSERVAPTTMMESNSKYLSDEEDDRALEELLVAKRNARRSALEVMQQPRLSLDDLVVTTTTTTTIDQEEEAERERQEEANAGCENEHRQFVGASRTDRSQASPLVEQPHSPTSDGTDDVNDHDSDDDDRLSIDL